MLDIPRPFEVLSDVSNDSSHNGRDCDSQEIPTSERIGPQPSSLSVSAAAAASAPSISMAPQDKNPLPLKKSKKKSKKHKVKERSKGKQRSKEKEEMKGRSSGEEHTPETHRGCEKTPQPCKSNSGPLMGEIYVADPGLGGHASGAGPQSPLIPGGGGPDWFSCAWRFPPAWPGLMGVGVEYSAFWGGLGVLGGRWGLCDGSGVQVPGDQSCFIAWSWGSVLPLGDGI